MTTAPTRTNGARAKHYDDAPDTAADFERMASLPEGAEKEALRQDLVRAWMPMAERLSRRFRNRGENVEDLRQVASLGLVKAVRRYDPARGSAFESFAVPTIVGEVKRHFRDHMWGLHVPRRVQELRNRVRMGRRELSLSSGERSPTAEEIAAYCHMSVEDVLLGMEALESYSTLSLDAELPGADDGYSLADTLGSAEPGFETVVYRESVKPLLRELPEREQHMLYLRFFCDMTQSRIADHFGISQMHVSRLLSRTCARIHDQIEAQAPAEQDADEQQNAEPQNAEPQNAEPKGECRAGRGRVPAQPSVRPLTQHRPHQPQPDQSQQRRPHRRHLAAA